MPKTYFIQTFGCQMNQSDSERMASYLEGIGFIQANDWKNADYIVLNTCSVRQKAEDRINGIVNNIREKSINPNAQVILTGCMTRRIWDDSKNVKNSFQKDSEERESELKKSFPKVDIVIETKDFPKLNQRLGIEKKFSDSAEHYLSYKPKYKNNFQAFVPISTGCNHFCTFCIVPYSRGKEVCRPASEIIREVFDLVKNGYKDVTLLGQTVNRWINPDFKNEFNYNEAMTYIEGLNKKSLDKKSLEIWKDFFQKKLEGSEAAEIQFEKNLKMPRDFLQLLQILDQIPGNWWTTWVSSHPNYMTDELIEFIGSSSKSGHQKPYIHFALQSGSNKILKRMNRRYNFEEFYSVVEKMRKVIPDVSLSTDIIVGFIGETEDDFLESINAEKKCRFDMIFISEYSPRKGTASARLKDEIPNEVKAKRKIELNDALKEIALENNNKLVGSTQQVLADGIHRKTGLLTARTCHNKEIQILGVNDKSLIGKFIQVKVTKAAFWSLEGTMIRN